MRLFPYGIRMMLIICMLLSAPILSDASPEKAEKTAREKKMTFPVGADTQSEVCGRCHTAIYREYAFGFGSDQGYKLVSQDGKAHTLPHIVSSKATGHALTDIKSFSKQPKQHEMAGTACAACHLPESFTIPRNLEISETDKPKVSAMKREETGLSCVSCHLTPEGKIRGPYNINAPHENRPDVNIKTSLMCAYCHSLGKRVPGNQTQTFLEWRDDFFLKGLGRQNCQDCHMPHTMRRLTEDTTLPERVSSRHLWTGGRSLQRLLNALSQVIVQPVKEKGAFDFHVINIGAGHSVPTGSHRRAVYLQVQAISSEGKTAATQEWTFAPWSGNGPNDSTWLDEFRKMPGSSVPAEALAPHETIIRAGEERVLHWSPTLAAGRYTITSRLVYDLNRYNDRSYKGDQTRISETSLEVSVK
ncbi:cytochrome c3 family protein [Pelotalea chapellei]|uniref:Outer membrane cytochrome MtrC/MtrF-like domain-containing protein n=1 Tax=Pelotalea chapellei TaxID=44671 RepID=A0ABS5U497_9BACT|nr:cytochrome c3 family protein [Pelotalea chapellei]MBT1070480.1 hypothetical protein [Pelotalea chapellei]